jgi:hypothetical protein
MHQPVSCSIVRHKPATCTALGANKTTSPILELPSVLPSLNCESATVGARLLKVTRHIKIRNSHWSGSRHHGRNFIVAGKWASRPLNHAAKPDTLRNHRLWPWVSGPWAEPGEAYQDSISGVRLTPGKQEAAAWAAKIPRKGLIQRTDATVGLMIAKTYFLVKIIHRIDARSFHVKKTLRENHAAYRIFFAFQASRWAKVRVILGPLAGQSYA